MNQLDNSAPFADAAPSPFGLDDAHTYAAWREQKLADTSAPAPIEIDDLGTLNDDERNDLLRACATRNFALFRAAIPPADPQPALHAFGRRLGLLDIDQNLCAEDSGLTAIAVKKTATDKVYIPYTNRPLGWHTDGYYNAAGQQVHAWLLYCARPAAEGGANALLDHDIAYIRLRDQNPDWIRALMQPDAFTIPGNREGGKQIRPDHSGPVFEVSPRDGSLHMRYSARQRNVIWKDDKATRDAAAFLLELLTHEDEHTVRCRLTNGEGLISNNVLHRRDGFRDAADSDRTRLIFRARYHQRLPRPEEV